MNSDGDSKPLVCLWISQSDGTKRALYVFEGINHFGQDASGGLILVPDNQQDNNDRIYLTIKCGQDSMCMVKVPERNNEDPRPARIGSIDMWTENWYELTRERTLAIPDFGNCTIKRLTADSRNRAPTKRRYLTGKAQSTHGLYEIADDISFLTDRSEQGNQSYSDSHSPEMAPLVPGQEEDGGIGGDDVPQDNSNTTTVRMSEVTYLMADFDNAHPEYRPPKSAAAKARKAASKKILPQELTKARQQNPSPTRREQMVEINATMEISLASTLPYNSSPTLSPHTGSPPPLVDRVTATQEYQALRPNLSDEITQPLSTAAARDSVKGSAATVAAAADDFAPTMPVHFEATVLFASSNLPVEGSQITSSLVSAIGNAEEHDDVVTDTQVGSKGNTDAEYEIPSSSLPELGDRSFAMMPPAKPPTLTRVPSTPNEEGDGESSGQDRNQPDIAPTQPIFEATQLLEATQAYVAETQVLPGIRESGLEAESEPSTQEEAVQIDGEPAATVAAAGGNGGGGGLTTELAEDTDFGASSLSLPSQVSASEDTKKSSPATGQAADDTTTTTKKETGKSTPTPPRQDDHEDDFELGHESDASVDIPYSSSAEPHKPDHLSLFSKAETSADTSYIDEQDMMVDDKEPVNKKGKKLVKKTTVEKTTMVVKSKIPRKGSKTIAEASPAQSDDDDDAEKSQKKRILPLTISRTKNAGTSSKSTKGKAKALSRSSTRNLDDIGHESSEEEAWEDKRSRSVNRTDTEMSDVTEHTNLSASSSRASSDRDRSLSVAPQDDLLITSDQTTASNSSNSASSGGVGGKGKRAGSSSTAPNKKSRSNSERSSSGTTASRLVSLRSTVDTELPEHVPPEPVIMFSGFPQKKEADSEWRKEVEYHRVVKHILFGEVVQDENHTKLEKCNMLVIYDRDYKRKHKFFLAILLGMFIVTPDYLEDCIKAVCFQPVDNAHHIPKNLKFDQCPEFDMETLLLKSRSKTRTTALFDGMIFYFIRASIPNKAMMEDIQALLRASRATIVTTVANQELTKLIVIGPEIGDSVECKKLIKEGFTVVTKEYILTGLLRYALEPERYAIKVVGDKLVRPSLGSKGL